MFEKNWISNRPSKFTRPKAWTSTNIHSILISPAIKSRSGVSFGCFPVRELLFQGLHNFEIFELFLEFPYDGLVHGVDEVLVTCVQRVFVVNEILVNLFPKRESRIVPFWQFLTELVAGAAKVIPVGARLHPGVVRVPRVVHYHLGQLQIQSISKLIFIFKIRSATKTKQQ